MSDDFQADYRGIGDMLTSDFMVEQMRVRAEAGRVYAVAVAPIYTIGPHPGRYKASFHVDAGVQHHRTSRAYGELSNDSREAFWVEYGTKNNPARHILHRALEVMQRG